MCKGPAVTSDPHARIAPHACRSACQSGIVPRQKRHLGAKALSRPGTHSAADPPSQPQDFVYPSCLLDSSVSEVFSSLTTVKALRTAVQSKPSLRDDLISLSSRPWLTELLSSLLSNAELNKVLDDDPEFRCEVQILMQSLDQTVRPEDVSWLVQALYKVSVHPVIYSVIDVLEELLNPDRLASVDEAIVLGVSADRLYSVMRQLNQVPPDQFAKFVAICRDFWTVERIDASLDFLDQLFASDEHLLPKLEHALDMLLADERKTYEQVAIHQVFILLLKSTLVVGSCLDAHNLPAITAAYDAAIQSPRILQDAVHKVFHDRLLQNNGAVLLAALHVLLQPCIIKQVFANLSDIVDHFQSSPSVATGAQLSAASRWRMYTASFRSLSPCDLDNFLINISAVIVKFDQEGSLDLVASSQLPSQLGSAINKLFLLCDFFSSPAMLQKLTATLSTHMRDSNYYKRSTSTPGRSGKDPLEAAWKLRIEKFHMFMLLALWRVIPDAALSFFLDRTAQHVRANELSEDSSTALSFHSRTN